MATVSLVLVSHSLQLAEGVRELASQMTQGKVKIAVAGGTADGRLGTDANAILGAIEAVRGPEGVLILVDLAAPCSAPRWQSNSSAMVRGGSSSATRPSSKGR